MPTKSVILIDSRVSNYQSLIDSLNEPAEVFVLDAESDGLSQIAAYLQDRYGIDAIHVVSHGSQGALYLGNTVLNSSNLACYTSQLASIGSSLTESGDILLYGCNVARGDIGLQFVASLAQFTGADLAASDDATGAAALGGDWVLEQKVGGVDATTLQVVELSGLLVVNTAPTFVGSTGKVTTDFDTGSIDAGRSVAVQVDGKILFGGGGGSSGFKLARYNNDGSLDTTFDSDGKVTTGIGTSSSGTGTSVTVQADGKILLGGVSNSDFALARYNSDGSLDTSFHGDGKVTTDFDSGLTDYSTSITVQADGKILLGGYSGGGFNNFALARYNGDGSLDSTFDGDGKLTTGFGSGLSDSGTSITVQADGKILLGGISSGGGFSNLALARYNSDGSLDTTFDSDGKLTTGFSSGSYSSGTSVTVQADGKILLGGFSNSDFALARYNSDGSLDTSFHGDGKVITGFGSGLTDYGTSITVQADGKILLGGFSSGGSYDFALARYNSNGSLDTSFDGDGKVTTGFGSGSYEEGYSVSLQSDGKILLGGYSISSNNYDFALARYNSDGSLDTSFGSPIDTLSASPNFTEPGSSYGDSGVVVAWGAQILDAELAVNGNYNGATLTLQRHNAASAQDVFSSASSVLSTLTPNSYFSVDSVTIGRVTTNSAGTLALTFNANATQSLVNKAMQQIAYANTSDAPPATVQIDWTFDDGNTGAQGTGGAMSVTGSTTVQITATNDAPVLSIALVDQVVSANTAFSHTIPADSFSDPDLETLAYVVAMADGTGVPPWLTFTPATRTFSGTASNSDTGAFDILVTAKDAANAAATDIIRFTVNASNILPTGAVTITGTPTQGQTLSANTSTLADANGLGTLTYQWKAAGLNIASANSSTLVLAQAQVGKAITVTASYTDGLGTAESVTSTATSAVANINDLPTGVVTINGTAARGQILTAANTLADVDGLGTITYQWKAAGTLIAGATGSTYTLTPAEVGKAITVAANFTDGFGVTESVSSSATSLVIATNAAPTGTVTVTGTATQGQILTASNTLADADGLGSISYQWLRAGNVIAGAISSTYTLSQSDVSTPISARASYTDGLGANESVTSIATVPVVNVNDQPTGGISVTGTATQGQTLVANSTLADLDGMGALSYQWKANGLNISAATSSFYTLTEAEVGKTLSVLASYTDALGTAESSLSANTTAVLNVNDLPSGTFSIGGSVTQGQTLVAVNGLTDLDGMGTLSYQWMVDATAVSGATSSTFTLSEAHVGKIISLVGNYTDGHGTPETVTTASSSAVANLNDLPTGTVTVSGTAALGQTLTASNTLADIDGLGVISYQWNTGGANIFNGTGNSIVLSQVYIGTTISVTALYTDGHGTKEAVTSAPTDLVLGYQQGTQGGDALTGSLLGEAIDGLDGNDAIDGGKGNDRIDGGTGADTAAYSGKITDYFIKYNRALGTATITDHRANADGIDSLKSIEKLQFADKTFDLLNPARTESAAFGKSQSFLFDPAYYLLKHPDLVPTVTLATAFDSYKTTAAQGAAPNTWFDPVYYANRWADLKPLNLDAVTLFAHYNLYGVWEGRSAGPTFDKYDGARYLTDNPDVASYVDAYVADFLGSRSNGAIAHYVIYGAAEGRVAYDTAGVAIEQAILIGVPG